LAGVDVIPRFIAYLTQTMAKFFRWVMAEKPLTEFRR
jgi:hypothetical protein